MARYGSVAFPVSHREMVLWLTVFGYAPPRNAAANAESRHHSSLSPKRRLMRSSHAIRAAGRDAP
jgi:hypothetical protein